MNKIKIIALCVMIMTVGHIHASQARPVSYPGGWTIMQMNDADSNSLHLHYSPTAKYSLGYKGEYWSDQNWYFNALQLNYLAKRWNHPNSQANLYVKSAIGAAYQRGQGTEPATFTGIALDWEDRRYFTSYENRLTYANDIEKGFRQKARVGLAPYIGDYGDIHTWLMIEIMHNPTADQKFTVTPLVRLFKGEYLAEAGISNRGDMLFNTVIRF